MSYCQRLLPAGTACDPRSVGEACSAGLGCVPNGPHTGVCAATVPEVEPNGLFAPRPLGTTTSTAYSGTLDVTLGTASTGSDADCFDVTVPEGGSISLAARYAQSVNCINMGVVIHRLPLAPLSGPPVLNTAFAFDPIHAMVCPWMSPDYESRLADLPGGTYTTCVTITSGASGSAPYTLSIGVHPP
ncbi:MAG: hypothetical protein IT379_02950 [Deltaproteobacteria bacterium]|nr:hypothetical protein [Deltaproteobacteria bacterium]